MRKETVSVAEKMLTKNEPKYAVVLALRVKVDEEAQILANKAGVKILKSNDDNIYSNLITTRKKPFVYTGRILNSSSRVLEF